VRVIEKAGGRNEEAVDTPHELAEVCRREYPRLVGMLGLYCGDVATAEELSQEALARLWRAWPKVAGYEDPAAWVRRVAINLANSNFRRAAAERRVARRLRADSIPRMDEPSDSIAIREAVKSLPKRQRTAVLLRFFLDLPYVEVAQWMNVPESTAKSLVRRGVARLRTQEGFTTLEEAINVT